MRHGATHRRDPYHQVWADAQSTLGRLIAEVHALGERLDESRRNLNWQGGSEQYFQYEAARQHHYLQRNNDLLRLVQAKVGQAGASPTVFEYPLQGTPSGGAAL